MAIQATPLTEKQIKSAKRENKIKLFDGGGLYLSIEKSGSKFWRFRYKHPITKREKTLSLGRYPLVKLSHARRLREEAKSLLFKNIDPLEYKNEKKSESSSFSKNTFEAVFLLLLEQKKIKGTCEKTINNFKSFILKYLIPFIGHIPISKITTTIEIDALHVLKNKGFYRSIIVGCSRINEVMNHGVNIGIIKHNYLSNLSKMFTSPQVKHHKTLKQDEFKKFLFTLNLTSNLNQTAKLALIFQILTMTRPCETIKAKWNEINFDRNLWIIPAERMKKRREHKVFLSPYAMEVLHEIKRYHHLHNSCFIFPTSHLNHNKPISTMLVRLQIEKIGYKNKVVPHGFRSLASTILNEKGVDYDVIESALSHVDTNTVRRAYNHAEYEDKKKSMLTWWGNYIKSLTTCL